MDLEVLCTGSQAPLAASWGGWWAQEPGSTTLTLQAAWSAVSHWLALQAAGTSPASDARPGAPVLGAVLMQLLQGDGEAMRCHQLLKGLGCQARQVSQCLVHRAVPFQHRTLR